LPHGAEKANEFKRYRQILGVLYSAVIGLGFLLLAASVVKELFFRPVVQLQGPVLSAENPSLEDLLRCHRDVLGMYQDLDRVTARLVSQPLRGREGDDRDVIGEWETFSREWLTRWERVNAFCRFSELADTSMGAAYDRMAQVHGALPVMRLKYQSLLVRFEDEQAAELSRMRRDLERSEKLLRELQDAHEERAP
jgi:hypothetical protein